MYTREQIIEARQEIELALNNLNILLFQRTDVAPYRDRDKIDIQLASREVEKLKDLLAFL